MRTTASQQEKEHSIKAVLGEQLNKNSNDVIKDINSEIILTAIKLTNIFLGDAFRTLFSIERSSEATPPVIFQLGDTTDLILYDRLNAVQIRNLPYYILNEEVQTKNFQPVKDMNFVVLIDLSLSMIYRWPFLDLVTPDKNLSNAHIDDLKDKCRRTKLYALKYLAYTFLDSAIKNNFKTSAIFFSNQDEYEIKSGNDKNFSTFVLNNIDENLLNVYAKAISVNRYSESGGYLDALLNFIHKRKNCIVLFLSDFLDGIEDLKPYLIELSYTTPLIMAVINDPLEVSFPARNLLTPVTVTREHCKNMENNLEEGVHLSNRVINQYNIQAARRRKDIFGFFNQHRISHLDIQTQNNLEIPDQLQKLNAQLLSKF